MAVVGGGFAYFALTGDDAPPPPSLPGSGGAPVRAPAGTWLVQPTQGAFAGYRVDEKYLGVGVRTAVGRTPAVTGTLVVAGGRLVRARLVADLDRLRSDQTRRDDALRGRGIETDRYPRARFALTQPVALSSRSRPARGTLSLHGRSAPVVVSVAARGVGARLELVGTAPIAFGPFAIDPPSVAGLVTVRDHGVLEFRLWAARSR